MNPNMPIKSRTRRNTRVLPEQETQSPSMAINHHQQSYMKMEQEHHHYRLMEQQQQHQQQHQQQQQETDQMYVLDLSLKNKKNSDVEASSREMDDDDDVKMKSTNHSFQSFMSLNGFNKPAYTSNDMTLFWNMLMHFSFNNYNNYFNQQLKDGAGFDALKGRY
jgi:hypothetical protein